MAVLARSRELTLNGVPIIHFDFKSTTGLQSMDDARRELPLQRRPSATKEAISIPDSLFFSTVIPSIER